MKSGSQQRKIDELLTPTQRRVSELLATRSQTSLSLDVGCGDWKQEGCIGMDMRDREGVDVVHDAEVLPWPFQDDTFTKVILSHVMEHLNPKLHVLIMDEIWRVTKPGGVVMLAMPYPGSMGHWQDPTHIKPWNEATPTYFDPEHSLYTVYRPKPWKIEANVWRQDGNIEIVMRKREKV